MDAGAVIAGRFEVQEQVGSGGMGAVFRARDRDTGHDVAVKVVHGSASMLRDRFAVETRVLAELQHPTIVRYVAHGMTDGDEPYLVMEWLEGEDLSARLLRAPLSLRETVDLGLRVAEALGAVHGRGVVHRDLKPGNIFLPGGIVADAKLLDFGLARLTTAAGTRTGVLVGTPGYLAPEQARGDRDIDTRADLFSMGCVLYECLTGAPPFSAEHPMAVLAKIILEESPRLLEVRPDAPASLDRLVGRLLAKHREGRPATAAEVAAALHAIGARERFEEAATRATEPPPALTTNEQHLLSVVLVAAPEAVRLLRGGSMVTTAAVDGSSARRIEAVELAAKPHGARVDRIAGGSAVVTLSLEGATANDHARRAARCALSLRMAAPEASIALVTCWGDLSTRGALGGLVDRAARIMRGPDESEAIAVDDVTAGLLDARFVVNESASGLVLRSEREHADTAARLLLGRPTPCVGRDKELAVLRATFERCVSEQRARAVIVSANAGVGKSRLASEFVASLRSSALPIEVWMGRGDPMRAGAPFGLLSQAIRSTVGLFEGEPIEVRRERLRGRIARNLEPLRVDRVTEFIGEMIGTPFPQEGRVQLRIARQSSVLMGDQMRRAWEEFLAASAAARPLLLVLDDVHWGDLPSFTLLDRGLRYLGGLPWMVLALARPEVFEQFPKLRSFGWTEMELSDLTPMASERLVRDVLGEGADADKVARVVERAGGNALFLEELIRAAAAGEDSAAPRTVLAMVQARLERLSPDSRRVLRAASVFGDVFWTGGVAQLLGEPVPSEKVRELLEELVSSEVLGHREGTRFAGAEEYAFRHPLARDAAYAMLTDEDRALGHRLAAAWLEDAGETEAVTLAEHRERGGDTRRAAVWYRRAAEQALEGNDLVACIARAERGVACSDNDREIGRLRILQAEAHSWSSEWSSAVRCGLDAVAHLPSATADWYRAAAQLARARGRQGEVAEIEALVPSMIARHPEPGVEAARLVAASEVAAQLLMVGRNEAAETVLDAISGAEQAADPLVRAGGLRALAFRALTSGDNERARDLFAESAASFEDAGDLRAAAHQRGSTASVESVLGCYEAAERRLRETLVRAERIGVLDMIVVSRANLGMVLAALGRLDEARALEEQVIAGARREADVRWESFACLYLASTLELQGNLDEAEACARHALELSRDLPPTRAHGCAILASTLLRRGGVRDVAEALEITREAMAIVDLLGGIEEGEGRVRLAYAKALSASGLRDEARTAALSARQHLLARADRIRDPALRQTFLHAVRENAETLSLLTE
jgi:tetratricopeptide (TPR) repeat protein